MRRLITVALLSVFVVSGCAAGDEGVAADSSEDSLAGSMAWWDEAVAAGDADDLNVVALALPWHVVRDCGPNLGDAEREALSAEGDVALEALAAAKESEGAPLGVSAIVEAVGSYVESVRETCL